MKKDFAEITSLLSAVRENVNRLNTELKKAQKSENLTRGKLAEWTERLQNILSAHVVINSSSAIGMEEPSEHSIQELEELSKISLAKTAFFNEMQRSKAIYEQGTKYMNWLSAASKPGAISSTLSAEAAKVENAYKEYLKGNEMCSLLEACKESGSDVVGSFNVVQKINVPILSGFADFIPPQFKSVMTVENGKCMLSLEITLPDIVYFNCRSNKLSRLIMESIFSYLSGITKKMPSSSASLHWRNIILDTHTMFDTSIDYLLGLEGPLNTAYTSPACHTTQEANDTLDDLWVLLHSANPEENGERYLVVRGSNYDSDKLRRLVDNAQDLKLRVFVVDENTKEQIPDFILRSHAAVFCENDIGELVSAEEGMDAISLKVTQDRSLTPEKQDEIIKAAKPVEKLFTYFNFKSPVIPYLQPNGYDPTRKGNRHLRLTYGITDDGGECILDTNDSDKKKGSGGSSAYIVGGTGSGKSTLLHTLIASIALNYHPDDVEIWLADFKMKEFSRYITCPLPHIKYVLLDESADMVRSLVDELVKEMKERQKAIAFAGVDYYQKAGLPTLVCIIDEFSRMSQALSDDQEYKIKLQNLFTQGRDQGIRIILSSQTYQQGVSALNDVAKQQIGIRIAMTTNDKNDMKDELAVPRRLSDMEDELVRMLPRFKAVERKVHDSGAVSLQRANILFFNDDDTKKQRELFAQLLNMRSVQNSEELNALRMNDPENAGRYYLDKDFTAICGDPRLLSSFEDLTPVFEADLEKRKKSSRSRDGDLLLWLGRSRRLEKSSSIIMRRQENENMLVVSNYKTDDTQYDGLRSLIHSMITSCGKVNGQRFETQIWASRDSILPLDEWAKETTVVTNVEQMQKNAREIGNKILKGEKMSALLVIADPDELVGSQSKQTQKKAYSNLAVYGSADGNDAHKKTAAGGFTGSNPFMSSSFASSSLTASQSGDENILRENTFEIPDGRPVEKIIPLLISSGPENGLHVVVIGTSLKTLLENSILPGNNSRLRFSFFRHRIAFRLDENDEQNVDWGLYSSRNLLQDNLSNCFAYKDEQQLKVREPYSIK